MVEPIVIDDREHDLIDILLDMGIDFDINHLETGDIIIHDFICIERKTYDDMIKSAKDGRWSSQNVKMVKNYKMRMTLIEYDGPIDQIGNFNIHSSLAILASTFAKYFNSVVHLRNINDTAYFILQLADKYNKEIVEDYSSKLKPNFPIVEDRDFERLIKAKIIHILSSFPEISTARAEKIFDMFKYPYNFLVAVKESEILYTKSGNAKGIKGEIKKVDGIGWKILKELKMILIGPE